MTKKIILASGSPFRSRMLEDAGIAFTVERPSIDERAVEEAVADTGLRPDDLAQILAEAKAVDVSQNHPGAFVIGCDQTLSLGEELLHKPADMEEARRRLLKLSGRTHQLNSAVVIAQDGEAIWRHVQVASLTMRDLDPGFIGRHLSAVGDAALSSVGAYQIEGKGIQLFDQVEGDHFTIVGLPLLPLLAKLRELGAIDG
ncbi:Maf-like protein [Mesorhizobium sp. YIM 152430]|uniref:Maf-like protein n=1 Tax=Mesorhizobium sp. YIM 152430 TaxID=3031761 RepID=UPI0023DC7A83|nr:Maf-like protein [Mesorhizobium sp. YIM 152430]MDF1600739.1 Maf-like protein [Mesorhizobium sp. YIM 152430]